MLPENIYAFEGNIKIVGTYIFFINNVQIDLMNVNSV